MTTHFKLAPWLTAVTLAVGFTASTSTFAYNQSDLDQLLKTNACNGCDLSNADLSNKELYGAALKSANLRGANLTNALLKEAKLDGANFSNTAMTGAIVNAATASGTDFTGANLKNSKFINTQIDGANFTKADMSQADFSSVIASCSIPSDKTTCTKFVSAIGVSTVLNSATLIGADLSNMDLTQASLRKANLDSAILQGTNFCNTDLSQATMPNRTLYNGDVTQFGADSSCNTAKTLTRTTPGSAVNYCSNQKSIFSNPQNIQLGITPTGWSNSDDLSIDLVPPIPYQQIMSEISLAGFKGTQNSPKFPKDMDVLLSELKLRDITISEPWVGSFYTIGAKEETQAIFDDQVKFMQTIGGDVIVVAEMGGAVHQQPIAPLPNRPKLNKKQWKKLLKGLNTIGKQAHEANMKLVYHFHIGTAVETMADIDKLMKGTNPDYVHLLLDTGHAYYAGVDPLEVVNKYADRIAHVHLKNIRQSVLDESVKNNMSFLNSVRAGIFTVPGDEAGVIDFDPILQKLADAKYQGWIVVEAEQDPNKANPLEYALIARNYLCDFAGL